MATARQVVFCFTAAVIACATDVPADVAEIELVPVATFQTPADSLDIFFSPNVVELRGRRWLVGPTLDEARLLEFDSAGRFLRVVGASGDGPGEYRRIGPLVTDSAGGVWVFDLALRRLTILDPDDLLPVRTASLDFSIGAVPVMLPGKRFAHSSIITSAAKFGLPVHISDSSGRVLSSFGGETVPDGTMPGLAMHRVVQRAQGDDLWLAHRLAPIVEQLSLDGRLLRIDTLVLDWFGPDLPSRDTEYDARIDGLISLGSSRVLLLVKRRRAETTAPPAAGGPRREGPRISASRLATQWESWLFAADLESGEVVGEVQLSDYAVGLQAPDRVVVVRETEDGTTAVGVARVVVN